MVDHGTSSTDGNLVAGNAGWYLLHVTNGTSGHAFEVLKPEIYVFGPAVGGKWSFDAAPTCEIPTTKDGSFVTPEFTGNAPGGDDDGLRLCVKIGNFDWWKTEFIIKDGKIEFRGKGDSLKGSRLFIVLSLPQQLVYLHF